MEQREPAVVARCASKRALSTPALAAHLDISRQSVRRAIKAGFAVPTGRTPGGQARFTTEYATELRERVQAARDRGRVRLIRHLLGAPNTGGHVAVANGRPCAAGAGFTVAAAFYDYWREHVIPNVVDRPRIETAFRHLDAWFKDTPLKDIDIPASRAYADARRQGVIGGGKRRPHARGADSTIIRRELVALRAAARHALRWRRITVNDLPSIELPREPRKEAISEKDWLTKDELRTVIAAARGRLRDFILIAYYTAGRRRSVEGLTKAQVNLEAGQINLRRPDETPQQQRSTKRRPIVPLHAEIRPTVERLMGADTSKWLLENPRSIYREFYELVRAIVPAKKSSPHVLRHSRATHLLQEGVPIFAVGRLLGDSVATVERVYAHCSVAYLAAVIGDKGP
jgi:integrase